MKQTGTFTHAKRKQESLLAPLERPALQWLVRHFPAWVNSDHLTLLAILSMFGAGLCFWGARDNILWLLAVPFALALNWFGDSTDGTLAGTATSSARATAFMSTIFVIACPRYSSRPEWHSAD